MRSGGRKERNRVCDTQSGGDLFVSLGSRFTTPSEEKVRLAVYGPRCCTCTQSKISTGRTLSSRRTDRRVPPTWHGRGKWSTNVSELTKQWRRSGKAHPAMREIRGSGRAQDGQKQQFGTSGVRTGTWIYKHHVQYARTPGCYCCPSILHARPMVRFDLPGWRVCREHATMQWEVPSAEAIPLCDKIRGKAASFVSERQERSFISGEQAFRTPGQEYRTGILVAGRKRRMRICPILLGSYTPTAPHSFCRVGKDLIVIYCGLNQFVQSCVGF